MAITVTAYNSYKADLLDGAIDHVNDTIKVMLVDNTYTQDIDAHEFKDDIDTLADEISGTGYTAGGEALTSKTVTIDDTDNEGVFDAADLTWSTATFTAAGAIAYKDTGTASTSPLMFFIDFDGDFTASSSNFTITWATEGIININ